MASTKRAAPTAIGTKIPPKLRRIGERHAVLTPGCTLQLVDVELLRAQLIRDQKRLVACEEERQKTEDRIAETRRAIAEFEAAPIQRLEGDPEITIREEREVEGGDRVLTRDG